MNLNKILLVMCLLFILTALLAGCIGQEFGQWLTATLF